MKAPLSEKKITSVFSRRFRASSLSRTRPTPESRAVMTAWYRFFSFRVSGEYPYASNASSGACQMHGSPGALLPGLG